MTAPAPAGRPVPGPTPAAGRAVPEAEQSLHPGVAAALARLEVLDGAPVAERVEVLDGVHRLLQDALATLDEV